MSVYKELMSMIDDYVGYKEESEYDNASGLEWCNMDCADPVLHGNIVDECTKYLNGGYPKEMMSEDARYCINQWEDLMNSMSSYKATKEV